MTLPTHTHAWRRSRRKHGNPFRIFIECADPSCKSIMQSPADYLAPFSTSVYRGGKSKIMHIRLDLARAGKAKRIGLDLRKVLENFIDQI